MVHTELDVWKKSIELVGKIYRCCDKLPKSERFGLSSQMRRAAVSVPANIAEGAARKSTKEYLRFLEISYASLVELDTYYHILEELKYFDKAELPVQENIVLRKMLYRLQESLKKFTSKPVAQ